jgi:hypothetical protein
VDLEIVEDSEEDAVAETVVAVEAVSEEAVVADLAVEEVSIWTSSIILKKSFFLWGLNWCS